MRISWNDRFVKSFIWFVFLFLIQASCYAEEIYDVETAPFLRTKCYETGCYKRILIFSAPRTGSSLIYNIFRFLFEKDSHLFEHHNDFNVNRVVVRTHITSELSLIKSKDTLCIFTLRDPLAACVSNYRICTQPSINNHKFARELIRRHCYYLLCSKRLEKQGFKMIRLKYEDFANHLDFVFNLIEDCLHLAIDPKDKEWMKKCYSKENIFSCTKDLKGFSDYLPISGFHGEHVTLQEYAPSPDFVYWLNVYLKGVIPLFQAYGYFLDTPI